MACKTFRHEQALRIVLLLLLAAAAVGLVMHRRKRPTEDNTKPRCVRFQLP